MKYIDNNISFSNMVKYIDVVVAGSIGKSGNYHKYLQDYAETLTLLTLFTDYKSEAKDEDELFNEVMSICHSEEWKNEILPQIKCYEVFHYYVYEEIKYHTRPMAELSEALNSMRDLINKISEFANSIDIEEVARKANNVINAAENSNIVEFKKGSNSESDNND